MDTWTGWRMSITVLLQWVWYFFLNVTLWLHLLSCCFQISCGTDFSLEFLPEAGEKHLCLCPCYYSLCYLAELALLALFQVFQLTVKRLLFMFHITVSESLHNSRGYVWPARHLGTLCFLGEYKNDFTLTQLHCRSRYTNMKQKKQDKKTRPDQIQNMNQALQSLPECVSQCCACFLPLWRWRQGILVILLLLLFLWTEVQKYFPG